MQFVELRYPAVTDMFADQPGQSGVAQGQPAPLGDAVGLVVELIRPQLVEIVEQAFFQQPRMQLRHTVHREAADNGQVGHAYHGRVALLDDGHAAQALAIAGPAL